jgi:type IV pilus biogenesis protein CpaD/CtpE
MRSIPILIVLALFSACAKKEASATAASKPEEKVPVTNAVPAAPPQPQLATVSGTATVTVANAAPMDGFQSKTLNRTFDKIVFGALAAPAGSAPATKEQMAARHGQAAGGPEDTPDVKVPKAEGANAKTVAELWALRAGLNGKDVAV